MDKKLLYLLKSKAREILEYKTRFHCYAHAVEVLNNVMKLIDARVEGKYDKISLFAAALFHDVSNNQEKELEGAEAAEIANRALEGIKDFPKSKIRDVQRLIKSINEEKEKSNDEILLNAADEMAAFSELGLIRSFMISGNRGLKVKEAIEWQLAYLEKRFNKFKLTAARDLVSNSYKDRRVFLLTALKTYGN